MRSHAKAPSAASTMRAGTTTRARKSLFGMACLCVLGLTAFLGSGAPTAGAADGPCPNEEFRTGPGANLPECRAYEQVSPVDKNGGDILGGELASDVAGAGDAAVFSALTEFAGAPFGGSTTDTFYNAKRSATGWGTVAMIPPTVPPASPTEPRLSAFDLSRSLLVSDGVVASTPPDPVNEAVNTYLRDNGTGVVSPFLAVPEEFGGQPLLSLAATPSLKPLVFASTAVLTSDPGVPGAFNTKTYEKRPGEPVRLVSVQPDGTPFAEATLPGGAATSPISPSSRVGAVSDDGRHVFFGPGGSEGRTNIYRRTDGTTTNLVSPSQRTEPDPQGNKPKRFFYATPDGNRVLFSSAQLLTDDANTGSERKGKDLYRYDIAADEMIDVSATPGGNGAEVEGVVGFDEDAERVYYVAKGQVVPGQGTPGQANLYLWEDDGTADGQTRFIASLVPPTFDIFGIDDPGDSSNWFNLNGDWTARTSPDGRYLLFQSEADIPGGEDGGLIQVYRYDAEANGGAGQLDCVSCNPDGETPLGGAFVAVHRFTGHAQRWELPRALAPEGRVFFTSADDLLPQDTNEKKDAYLWAEGELHLLSTGTSDRDSFFYGASVDGSDAFILTADALVPQDGDDLTDLYTAHVNGGFASQFATPLPGCSGEECRGSSSTNPSRPSTSTAAFSGAESPDARKPRCRKGQKRVNSRNGKTRCVKKHRKGNRANSNRRAGR